MKKTVLSCIQPTGNMHLGNYFGAVQNWVNLQSDYKCIYGVVDYHAMTMPYDVKKLRNATWDIIRDLVAVGVSQDNLFIQSLVPEHSELSWIFNCFCSYGQLTRMTQFKDKSNAQEQKSKDTFISAGLLDYPVLQAADILIYRADYVPVGKDQLQHLEMTRDVASRFHAQLGETFILPEAEVQKETMYIPGTDGAKMSKSKGNLINLFQSDKKLRKQLMGIVSDSTAMEDPKNPDTDTTFALYSILASEDQITKMRANYRQGNYGYGHAKQALYEVILEQFGEAREKYDYYMNNLNEVDEALHLGAEKAKKTAAEVLERVRNKVGY